MTSNQFRLHLENQLLPFWNRLKDDEYGGFYGFVSHDNVIDPKGVKGVILNSRILWFYSAASRTLSSPELLKLADHAYDFLCEHCLDTRYGGVYWSLNYDGTPCDDMKHTYNQAFAIYALSVYYQVSGRREALDLAYDLYRLVESTCRDEDGYLEGFCRSFEPASNEHLSENGVMADRTMNTLLHLLEAYTELYRADHKSAVADSLRWILSLFKDRLYNAEKQIFEVFFDMDYHSLIDLESYGHNIEASWLIDRACDVLGDKVSTEQMQPVIDGLVQSVYRNAIDREFNAINNERENDRVDRRKVWWVQAEAVIGFWNAWQRDPHNEQYRSTSEAVWKFINEMMVDRNSGEWVEMLQPDGTPVPDLPLVQPWKCPYHNGRMCIEMIQRLGDNGN